MKYTIQSILLSCTLLIPAVAQQPQQSNEPMQRNQRNRTNDNSAMRTRSTEAMLESRLAESRSLAGADINVQVTGDKVTLTGKVGDEQSKKRAMVIARRTPGVRDVENNLTIDKAFVDQRRNVNLPDEQLSQNVAQEIAKKLNARASEDWLSGWEVQDAQWEIEVDADGGRIILDGDAASLADMQQAIAAARSVPGVKAVENEMALSYRGVNYGYPYMYGYGWGYPYPYADPFWP